MLLGHNQHALPDNGVYFEKPMLLGHNQHDLIPHHQHFYLLTSLIILTLLILLIL